MIYAEPAYSHCQGIANGAREFDVLRFLHMSDRCKRRGIHVALSIVRTINSGNFVYDIPIPDGLVDREAFIDRGRSMLRRFQMEGRTLESEVVADRLLLTY